MGMKSSVGDDEGCMPCENILKCLLEMKPRWKGEHFVCFDACHVGFVEL